MFGIGSTELLIILAIVIVVFGASRLPKLGRGLGEGLRGFKEALKGEEPKGGDGARARADAPDSSSGGSDRGA